VHVSVGPGRRSEAAEDECGQGAAGPAESRALASRSGTECRSFEFAAEPLGLLQDRHGLINRDKPTRNARASDVKSGPAFGSDAPGYKRRIVLAENLSPLFADADLRFRTMR